VQLLGGTPPLRISFHVLKWGVAVALSKKNLGLCPMPCFGLLLVPVASDEESTHPTFHVWYTACCALCKCIAKT
jgi:hypothetical protein